MSDEREIMTWEVFGAASRELAQTVADDYEPDMILSIARGGLLIGGALGHALSVKNVYTMNVEFYTGVDERLEVPRILPPAPDFVDASHFKILIADDVADTGHTLPRGVLDFCRGQGGNGAHGVLVREVPLRGQVRLCVEEDRPVDQLPLERQGPRRQARLDRQGRVTSAPAGCEPPRPTRPDEAPAPRARRQPFE